MEQFTQNQSSLTVLAPAKINISLLISGKRPDGYHELETVMAKIDYCDELLFEEGSQPGIELVCKGAYDVPAGRDNLVWKACDKLVEQSGQNVSVKVTLTKNIPAGTGLGSGSSDAAAALLGLNRFAGLGLLTAQLHPIAASLGSDINFFLGGPLAFCTGRGEKIMPIDAHFPFCCILIIPSVNTSTKRVYGSYLHDMAVYKRMSVTINAFLAEKKVDFVAQMCANMLEESCFQLHPELSVIKKQVQELTGRNVCLSGSGSAMYCMLDECDFIIAQRCREVLRKDFNCACRIVYNNRW